MDKVEEVDKVEKTEVAFTTGEVEITLPDKWKVPGANETMDGYIDKEARTDMIQVVKNMKEELDIFDKPSIQINYYNKSTEMSKANKAYYKEAENIEPIQLANYTWNGYQADSLGPPLALLFANANKAEDDQFQVVICMNTGGKGAESISVKDEDVLAIISSIKPVNRIGNL